MERTPNRLSAFGSPVGVLSVAVAVNVLVMLSVGFSLSQTADLLQSARERTIQLVSLRGEIARYDEVLTMSTRMAAASGDPSWEARYREFEPVLGAAIAEAERLVDPGGQGGVALTGAANRELVAMENRAFELVRGGDRARAAELLGSARYATQKEAYSAGLAGYMDQVEAELGAAVALQERRNLAARLGAGLGLVLLVAGWLLVLRRVARWREQIARAEDRVQQTLATLEERVEERTRALTDSHVTLRKLGQDLLNVEEAERERLALVLHDDLQQLLVSASLRLDAMGGLDGEAREDVDAARTALRMAIHTSRNLSRDLGGLDEDDLGRGLARIGQELAERYDLEVHVDCPTAVQLDPGVHRFLHRASRELLFNVVKHADAREAWLVVHCDGSGVLRLEIRDEGRGFERAPDPTGEWTGLGLPAIRRRAAWLGGDLRIDDGEGRGARVCLRVPVGTP